MTEIDTPLFTASPFLASYPLTLAWSHLAGDKIKYTNQSLLCFFAALPDLFDNYLAVVGSANKSVPVNGPGKGRRFFLGVF